MSQTNVKGRRPGDPLWQAARPLRLRHALKQSAILALQLGSGTGNGAQGEKRKAKPRVGILPADGDLKIV